MIWHKRENSPDLDWFAAGTLLKGREQVLPHTRVSGLHTRVSARARERAFVSELILCVCV